VLENIVVVFPALREEYEPRKGQSTTKGTKAH